MSGTFPTSHDEVNATVAELHRQVKRTLGPSFVGLYLEGSLALGELDGDSDVDFVVVTREEVSPAEFAALRRMHEEIAAGALPLARRLEGSYISLRAFRRYDPDCALHPNIERGRGLEMFRHSEAWIFHRHILRERGIVVEGPPAATLLDPTPPSDLRLAAKAILPAWSVRLSRRASRLAADEQAWTVLTLCRVLYTLEHGAVASKRVAAEWARGVLGRRWAGVIDRAWERRRAPEDVLPAPELDDVLQMMQLVIERSGVGAPPQAERPTSAAAKRSSHE